MSERTEQTDPAPASQVEPSSQVPLKITIGLWLLLAAFLVTGLVLTPPLTLTLYTKLLIFCMYTLAIPLGFVVAVMGLNRWFKTNFGRRNAFTLGTMSTLMLVIFLIGQSNV